MVLFSFCFFENKRPLSAAKFAAFFGVDPDRRVIKEFGSVAGSARRCRKSG